MPSVTITLGSARKLVDIFSYPNEPGSTESLPETIEHWLNQTLARDGYAAKGACCSVAVNNGQYTLTIDGPSGVEAYAERLPVFLQHEADALALTKSLKKQKRKQPWPAWLGFPKSAQYKLWDPQNTGTWRFFLPFGMAMVNQKVLNFFHYPPLRLLEPMRDYLDDPVPVRLIELMEANGIKTEEEAWLYSTVMDGAPIAAPDDQGTIYPPSGKGAAAHLLPIEYYNDYQRAQVELLLNTCSGHDKYTIPIVVWGTPARETFPNVFPNKAFGKGKSAKVPNQKPVTMSIVKGKKTHVIGAGHPYAFYAQGQTEVGAGSIKPEVYDSLVQTMTRDLVTIRWQYELAQNPDQDPKAVLQACQDYWGGKQQQQQAEALVLHQGSLYYPDPNSLQFVFSMSLEEATARIDAKYNW